jgi:hypothetical protein
MSNDDHWITTRITEALTHHPSVTEAVTSRMGELLKGQISEQQLSQKDLNSIAAELIAGMVPAQPETDLKQ